MAGSVNKVILLGRLGKEPDIRSTTGGNRMASFSIATSTKIRNKETQQLEDKTEWHNIVIFNERLADVCEKYVTKGSQVYIEGELQTRKWQDKDGNNRYTTQVIVPNYTGVLTLLGSKNQSISDNNSNDDQFDQVADEALGNSSDGPSTAEQLDDDIPF